MRYPKQRTIRNKRYMIEHHIIPLLGNKAMDGITPADIIKQQIKQNVILTPQIKSFDKTIKFV